MDIHYTFLYMNFDNQAVQELFIKNLLFVLSKDKSQKISEKKSFSIPIKELKISNELISSITSSWKANPLPNMQLPMDTKEAQDLLLLLLASLLYDDPISQPALESLLIEFRNAGLERRGVDAVLSSKQTILAEKSMLKRLELFKEKFQPATNPKISVTNGKKEKFYIANQVTYEGLDEIQRLLLAHKLGLHIAIDGPPGVGKTQSVLEVSNILGKKIFTKTCSSRTTESHIISFPILTQQDGVSVTAQENGPLVRAMIEGNIFYGDEFNLLKEDVQKRMNSAFDDRSAIDRMDGKIIQAEGGFWGVISYNPTNNMVARDLEESVADRFVHLHYDRWNADFKALVAISRAKNYMPNNKSIETDFGIKLQWRGILNKEKFLYGKEDAGKIQWFDFFTHQPTSFTPQYTYKCYDRASIYQNNSENLKQELDNLATSAFSEQELARMISRFTELLINLTQTGTSPMLKKIGMADLKEKEDLELLSLHESSTRIEVAAQRHYQDLLARGSNRYLAQSYAVRLVIDQVCYGQFRNKKLRENTTLTLVNLIARNMKLFADTAKYNTKMISESLLKQ